MFKTIRSKIFVSMLLMLAILMSAFLCYTYIFRSKTRLLILKHYSLSINTFAQQLDKQAMLLEENSKDLALLARLFYKTDRSIPLTKRAITRIFENHDNTIGGGIWFEPNAVFKDKKRFCFFAYRNKDNKIVFDDTAASEEYDYLNKNWYKEIKSQITKEKATAWSRPYFEKEGSDSMLITVGTGIFDNDKLLGIATVDWKVSYIFDEILQMKPLQKGFSYYETKNEIQDSFALFASETGDYIIAYTDPYINNVDLIGKSLKNIPWYSDSLTKLTYIKYQGKKYVPYVKQLNNGMMLIMCIPKNEIFQEISKLIIQILFLISLFAILIPGLLYLGLNRYIINPIYKLTNIARKIGKGEDIEIKIEKPEEFAQLASTFDKMTNDIKQNAIERERFNSELSIAKQIQESSIPNVFPAFPNNNEFDIYASMEPAKEVGGDFYDFYFIDDNNLMFLIADVSGKGIPAALFMMTVKTHINNMSSLGYSPEDLIKAINNKISQNNKQGYFVTMLIVIVNIKTGETSFINCGHNLPLLKHKNGQYETIKMKANIPVGLFENYDFQIYRTRFLDGDMLYMYTDGVTEALDVNEKMYGEEALVDFLNKNNNVSNIKELIINVKHELKEYTNSVQQSDDITMIGFNYKPMNIDEKTYFDDASMDKYNNFYNWVHEIINKWNLHDEIINKIDLCIEEIYINISSYAYNDKKGFIEVKISKNDDKITFIFTDSGFSYNPLEKQDPDITLDASQRQLGGLGVYMVKNTVNEIYYERINDKNVLKFIINCI